MRISPRDIGSPPLHSMDLVLCVRILAAAILPALGEHEVNSHFQRPGFPKAECARLKTTLLPNDFR
jgi:hypothetical protein